MKPENKYRYQPPINILLIGSCNSGKSTLVGFLFQHCGVIDKKVEMHLMQYIRIVGKEYERTNQYSWVLDKYLIDRENNLNDQYDVLLKFSYQYKKFNIIEVPGHAHFVKNLIYGKAQVDCVVVVVSAVQGQFQWQMEQKRQVIHQLKLCHELGIKNIIICISKMDSRFVDYSEERYQNIRKYLQMSLVETGYKSESVLIIPISGLSGYNVFKKSQEHRWYKQETLIQAIQNVYPRKLQQLPMRLTVEDVYKIAGIGTVPIGTLQQGVFRQGTDIIFMPSGIKTLVRSIEMGDGSGQSYPKWRTAFHVENVKVTQIKRGEVVGLVENPPKKASGVICIICTSPNCEKIQKMQNFIFYCHNRRIKCELIDIQYKISRRTAKQLERNSKQLTKNEVAFATIKFEKQICCEVFSEYPGLGRFILKPIDVVPGPLIAAGIITQLIQDPINDSKE